MGLKYQVYPAFETSSSIEKGKGIHSFALGVASSGPATSEKQFTRTASDRQKKEKKKEIITHKRLRKKTPFHGQ